MHGSAREPLTSISGAVAMAFVISLAACAGCGSNTSSSSRATAQRGSVAHGTVLASRRLAASTGGAVRAWDGVAMTVPPHAMRSNGVVRIVKVSQGIYDLQILASWRGRIAVTIPLQGRGDEVVHEIGGYWVPESSRAGQATVEVSHLSPFSTLLSKALSKIKNSLCIKATVHEFLDCLLLKGVSKINSQLAHWLLGKLSSSCAGALFVDGVGGGAVDVFLGALSEPACVGSAGEQGNTYPSGTAAVDVAPVNTNGQPKAGETIVDGGTAQNCESGSDIADQAYRCFTPNGIYDPCWLDNADPDQTSVLCQEHPWDTRITRLKVSSGGLESFFGPAQPVNPDIPWGVQLADGERCLAVQGTHDSYQGKPVDYTCGSDYKHVLLRPLNRSSPLWSYHSAYFDGTSNYTPGPLEYVATAWYANPDNGAAVDAKANDCTATALAYAAQAYEAAHNNPDGPLPEINAQACAAGYAEIVFTQPAPPPGYTATFAFKASLSGWQEIGKADFITPGEFGIPVSVGQKITSLLSSTPQTGHVAF